MEPEGDFHEELGCILYPREVVLHKQTIVQVKVQWEHYAPEEATWERENVLKQVYVFLFQNLNEN